MTPYVQHRFKTTLLFFLSLCCTALAQAELTFDINNTSHEFKGFGVQIWAGDVSVEPVLRDLHVKYARIDVDGFKKPFDVEGWTDKEYEQYYRDQNWQHHQKTAQLLKKYDIRMIANVFGAPANWKTDKPRKNSLDQKYYSHYAKRLAAALASMYNSNIKPVGIEIFNEPDGDWDCYVPPEGYDSIVRMLRKELDKRGLQELLIVGPGLAHIDTGKKEPWIDALTEEGDSAMGAWSIHGWQWDVMKNQNPRYARDSYLNGFKVALLKKDPEQSKQVFITEFSAAKVWPNDPDAYEKISFASRSVEDALSFLNCGANSVLFWEAADMNWSPHRHHGLIRLDKTARPVYLALQSIFANWPVDSLILTPPEQPDGDIYTASVLNRERRIVAISLVNSTKDAKKKTIHIAGPRSLKIVRCVSFENGKLAARELRLDATAQFTAALSANSTLTVVLSYEPE